MIFTKSGCSRIEPWIGSLKTFCIHVYRQSLCVVSKFLTQSFFAGGPGGSAGGWGDRVAIECYIL